MHRRQRDGEEEVVESQVWLGCLKTCGESVAEVRLGQPGTTTLEFCTRFISPQDPPTTMDTMSYAGSARDVALAT